MRMAIPLMVALLAGLAACERQEAVDEGLLSPVVAGPTETDIWVAELLDSGRSLRLGTPVNVTGRPGYDNQPYFLPDGSGFLYTSIDHDGIADTWRYDLDRGRRSRVLRSAASEFSPTPLPDGSGFAAVRVEEGGRQRLWRFDMDGGNAIPVFETIEPVGYHAWLEDGTVGLFVLGDPPYLVVAREGDETGQERLRSIGRSLHAVPGTRAFSVIHKASEDEWNIVSIEPGVGEPVTLAPALRPGEDYAWTPDGQIMMARGARVYLRRPVEGHDWLELADFSAHGITQITRIAVSPRGDRVALVVQR